jgi:polysaccharide deacetylase family protein (PEP-CTERM system associated)
MLNVLSVDVEDYFQVEAFASQVRYDQWDSFTPRVEQNVARILELFDTYGAKGTFFVLGWIAERFPKLVRKIAAAGHEIGCHSYAHKRLNNLTPDEFRLDLRRAAFVLQDQVQKPITCFRAPSFSIVQSTMWAFEILAEEGFAIDSSVFPVRHDLYGVPDANRLCYWQDTPGGPILEFPPSTLRFRNNNWAVAGGGYLRLFPYGLTHWAIRQINEVDRHPAMVYFHPWEIDPGQPHIRAGHRSTLRHYVNLSTMEQKIEHLLQDFRFTTLSDGCLRQKARTAVSRQADMPARVSTTVASSDPPIAGVRE